MLENIFNTFDCGYNIKSDSLGYPHWYVNNSMSFRNLFKKLDFKATQSQWEGMFFKESLFSEMNERIRSYFDMSTSYVEGCGSANIDECLFASLANTLSTSVPYSSCLTYFRLDNHTIDTVKTLMNGDTYFSIKRVPVENDVFMRQILELK